MRQLLRGISIVALGVSFAACSVETVAHSLAEEREANQIVELLAESDIVATKTVIAGRVMTFNIAVPQAQRLEAIKLLNRYELPRRHDMGYTEVFKESGLIPTSAEEKAKKLAALEGEIERQLKLIDGILDVQVQLVIPEDTALRTTDDQRAPTTASITIKYLPGAGGVKPLSEPQVQAVVAAGVEKLTPDNVVVVMTPVTAISEGAAKEQADKMLRAGTIWKRTKDRSLNVMAACVMGLVLLLSLGLAFLQLRLRTVRGRLIKLQNEIAKARRKPEGTPA